MPLSCRSFHCNPDLPFRNHAQHTSRSVMGATLMTVLRPGLQLRPQQEDQKVQAVERLNQWLKANPHLAQHNGYPLPLCPEYWVHAI